jgi:hypothetical protein
MSTHERNNAMSKNYGFDEAEVRITKVDGTKLAIFDVSRTVECQFVAISSNSVYLLETFSSVRDTLEFIARKEIKGATVEADEGVLDNLAQMVGFETWSELVSDERGENEVEFPAYTDAQGNEHAEF